MPNAGIGDGCVVDKTPAAVSLRRIFHGAELSARTHDLRRENFRRAVHGNFPATRLVACAKVASNINSRHVYSRTTRAGQKARKIAIKRAGEDGGGGGYQGLWQLWRSQVQMSEKATPFK